VSAGAAAAYADLDQVVARARARWRPPPRLRLSEWADRHFVLTPESAAVPGPWRTLPYQREILDAISDPLVEQVSVMKSARVGYTLCMSAAVGYFIAHEPSSILIVQPTVDDAKNYSKETIAPMLRDVPALSGIMFRDVEERGPKDPTATLRHKAYPGGVLSLIGANSGAGFRRVSRRVVMFDEVDAYPPSAGSEGDPINLGVKRTEAFHNRKIIAGSTPLVAGVSRIEEMFLAGDQRRFHVPCPQCGHLDILAFHEGERGHFMRWPDDKPEEAFFVCRAAGCVIEHRHKRWMVERGEWRADRPVGKHRSYHLWSALSYAPHASWGSIAVDFLAAKRGGPEKLRTFVNTTLGETWQEQGEAPEWERLYERREHYPIGSVPAGVRLLTAGVDVQKDRLVYEVVGWSHSKESWSIDAGVLMGDTSNDVTWRQLDELLGRTFPGADGRELQIHVLAIDSGYNTQQVYGWARRYPMSRVIATKGLASARSIIGSPSPVDLTLGGKRASRGYKVWIVGVDIAKSELYGWLRLPRPAEGEEAPPGYCHFPEYGEDFFRELTAEQLVTTTKRNGYTVLEWQLLPNRENHYLDCRVLARAAAARLGIDRAPPRAAPATPPAVPVSAAPAAVAQPAAHPPPRQAPPARPAWISGRRGPWIRK
jgi:phage terminase large subunit GpA-like protein